MSILNLSNLKDATKRGISQPNKYTVFLPNPGMREDVRKMAALAERTFLPGKTINTLNRITYGPPRKMPYAVHYDEITLTFVCSKDMNERYFFDRWQGMIADPDNHYFGYYDDYAMPITIVQYDEAGRVVYAVVIIEAYPIGVEEQEMSYSTIDEALKLRVSFAYRKWYNLEQWLTLAQDSGILDSIKNGGGKIPDLMQDITQVVAPDPWESQGGSTGTWWDSFKFGTDPAGSSAPFTGAGKQPSISGSTGMNSGTGSSGELSPGVNTAEGESVVVGGSGTTDTGNDGWNDIYIPVDPPTPL